ncbi:MAG TPA: glycosyltransferase [Devosiaceae bacterium]|nr:glycosyltransferase [Devosiaceae bacterium]
MRSPLTADIPWPIIAVDVTLRTVSSDVPRQPGAGALTVYWGHDVPLAQELFSPDDPLPDGDEFIRRGERQARATTPQGAKVHRASDLSLIIPTRGRPGVLRRCLASVAGQDDIPGEIIVVDNDPERPASRDVVGEFGFATYARESRPGLDHARNAGIAAASKPLLAFCDDDVVLHRAWAGRMAGAFDDSEVSAVTGLVLPLELRTAAQRRFEFDWGFGRGFVPIDFRHGVAGSPDAALAPWEVGAGASMAFRREVFQRLGLFDVRLDAGAAGCSGDSEMWYRILMEGGLCRYVPEVVAFHQHRETMAELKRQIRAYMRGHVTALFVQQQRYGGTANLRRALIDMPRDYGKRALRRLAGRRRAGDDLLGAEIAGCLEGFAYFLRHPRERLPDPSRRLSPT